MSPVRLKRTHRVCRGCRTTVSDRRAAHMPLRRGHHLALREAVPQRPPGSATSGSTEVMVFTEHPSRTNDQTQIWSNDRVISTRKTPLVGRDRPPLGCRRSRLTCISSEDAPPFRPCLLLPQVLLYCSELHVSGRLPEIPEDPPTVHALSSEDVNKHLLSTPRLLNSGAANGSC